jgi:hypothetical protein
MALLYEALRIALRRLDGDAERNDAVCAQCMRVVWVARRFDALREEARRRVVARRRPPLLATLATTAAPWARALVARSALLHADEPLPLAKEEEEEAPADMRRLMARYAGWMHFDLQRTLQLYEQRLQQKKRPHRDRGPYTYQLVMRERVADASRLKRRAVRDGEAESRRFLTLPDPHAAMRFVLDFQAVQPRTPLPQQISVNECGTHDATWRKWVLDIDASEERVRAAEFSTDVEALHVAVLDLASAIADALHRRGFLARPCPFAVLSRHTLPKKYSWHVTLCAFASYAQWTHALRLVLEHDVRPDEQAWAMARFIDDKVLANTRSQYMQIMGSTKVVAGVPATGRCFLDEGVYASTLEPIPLPPAQRAALMAAATSCMLHDPWSQPFVGLARTSYLDAEEQTLKTSLLDAPPPPPPSKKRKQRDAHPTEKDAAPHRHTKDKEEEALSMDALPAWMRSLVHHPTDNKKTTLRRIPSMDKLAYRPLNRLPAEHTVLLYAHVSGAACCPHALVHEKRLHRHRSDNAMLYCCAAPHPRMLMRCFSTHCPPGWVELHETHGARLETLRTPSVQWDALPPALAAWMRAPWRDATLTPVETPNPPCAATRIHVRATCTPLPFSPRCLVRDRRRVPPPTTAGEEGTVVVTEHRNPTIRGVSYRLWVHCPSEGWTELTRSALQVE